MTNTPVADPAVELPEWHRSESEYSILLYTLKQDGWHRGEPAMVNDMTIRIENTNGSTNDLGAIADKLLAALTPVADSETPDACQQEDLVTAASAEPVGWFGFDESTGEYTAEWCSVKPADANGFRPLYARPHHMTAEAAALVLPRAVGEDRKAGWTLPVGDLAAIKNHVYREYGEIVSLEAVEVIALEVERSLAAKGGQHGS